jgi:hypothetical protein
VKKFWERFGDLLSQGAEKLPTSTCLCLTRSVNRYWAHSDPSGLPETHPNARWQPLNEHLRQVATLAEIFAKEANPEDHAFHIATRASGLLHDLGKYTEEFQKKIRGEANLKAPHSAHGAAIALKAKAMEVAFAIAGHHAGLPDPKGGRACLWERTTIPPLACQKVRG